LGTLFGGYTNGSGSAISANNTPYDIANGEPLDSSDLLLQDILANTPESNNKLIDSLDKFAADQDPTLVAQLFNNTKPIGGGAGGTKIPDLNKPGANALGDSVRAGGNRSTGADDVSKIGVRAFQDFINTLRNNGTPNSPIGEGVAKGIGNIGIPTNKPISNNKIDKDFASTLKTMGTLNRVLPGTKGVSDLIDKQPLVQIAQSSSGVLKDSAQIVRDLLIPTVTPGTNAIVDPGIEIAPKTNGSFKLNPNDNTGSFGNYTDNKTLVEALTRPPTISGNIPKENPKVSTDPLDRLDQAVAGFGNTVSFGGTNALRELIYGEDATRNHQGNFYNGGQILGIPVSFSLGFGAPSTLARLTTLPQQIAMGYTAVGAGKASYDSTRNIIDGKATPWDALSFAPLIGQAGKVAWRGLQAEQLNNFRNNSTIFYSVQSADDAARLSNGGKPWPTEPTKANLGEGLYTWGNKSDAAWYQGKINDRGGEVGILPFRISNEELKNFKTLDLPSLSPDARSQWVDLHSRIYGKGLPHNNQYVINETGSGKIEHYFQKDVFPMFRQRDK
jgi:hypothetical protein